MTANIGAYDAAIMMNTTAMLESSKMMNAGVFISADIFFMLCQKRFVDRGHLLAQVEGGDLGPRFVRIVSQLNREIYGDA